MSGGLVCLLVGLYVWVCFGLIGWLGFFHLLGVWSFFWSVFTCIAWRGTDDDSFLESVTALVESEACGWVWDSMAFRPFFFPGSGGDGVLKISD